ncbi:MAG: restriction endonuclease subunit S [Ruminococcaceae bacterium]|nr:restriction endonuclease subunit S [Oscillospiraceae bacterium]
MLQDCRGIRLFNGQLPNANVTVFKKDDILLSNIRPYLKKIWLAEFDGACSNDVLVMRNKDTTKCSTEFLINLLKRQAFFDFVMQDVNGAKMPRGKKNHIMDYKVYIPDIKVQKTMLRQVEAMEGEIAACQTRLNELYSKTSEIVKSYLM